MSGKQEQAQCSSVCFGQKEAYDGEASKMQGYGHGLRF